MKAIQNNPWGTLAWILVISLMAKAISEIGSVLKEVEFTEWSAVRVMLVVLILVGIGYMAGREDGKETPK